MKPNELRIGNYCQTDKAYLLQVNALSENGIDFHLVDREKYPAKETWQAEFIPLTEEWLIRFGFEKIKHIHNGIYYLHKLTKISIYPNGMIELRGAPGFNKIHFVHQIQNLYFAFTGEELKLTDK